MKELSRDGFNICLIGVPEEENKGSCKEKVFKEIRAEDIQELFLKNGSSN